MQHLQCHDFGCWFRREWDLDWIDPSPRRVCGDKCDICTGGFRQCDRNCRHHEQCFEFTANRFVLRYRPSYGTFCDSDLDGELYGDRIFQARPILGEKRSGCGVRRLAFEPTLASGI